MKRGFVTNELLIELALFAVLFAISVPISDRIGWGKLGVFPISIFGFALVFCLLNSREIFDQFRNAPKPDREKQDDGESHDGLA